GFLVGSIPQSVVSVISGHVPYQSDIKIIIYRVLNGLNFNAHPSFLEMSLWDVLFEKPLRTFIAVLNGFWSGALYAAPSIILYFIVDDARKKSFSSFSIFVIVSYAGISSMGGTPRSPLLIFPFFLPCLYWLVAEIVTRLVLPWRELLERLPAFLGVSVIIVMLAFFLGFSHFNTYMGLKSRSVTYHGISDFLS